MAKKESVSLGVDTASFWRTRRDSKGSEAPSKQLRKNRQPLDMTSNQPLTVPTPLHTCSASLYALMRALSLADASWAARSSASAAADSLASRSSLALR